MSREQIFSKMKRGEHPAYLLLPLDDVRELGVGDPGVQLALHEGRPLVVFDVSQVAALRHLDVFGEALRARS